MTYLYLPIMFPTSGIDLWECKIHPSFACKAGECSKAAWHEAKFHLHTYVYIGDFFYFPLWAFALCEGEGEL